MIEFRRNHSAPIRGRSFLKRAVLLIFVVLAMIFWVVVFTHRFTFPSNTAQLHVSFIDSTHYLIDSDTTNYDDFASILKEKVSKLKKEVKHIDLLLKLPKDKNVGQLADIIQIANAFDGVTLKMNIE